MTKRILLAYVSKYGSTQEVAEKVADTLRNKGLEVDLQPARQVRSLEGYDAVVLGAPLYMYKWHKHATQFLNRHKNALQALPAAVFATGPSFNGDEKEWTEAGEQLDKELASFRWFKPLESKLFGGKFDPANLTFPMSNFLKDLPAADFRDWDAITKWAEELAGKLG
jgi:menaquinone-dependent protoporphyrinogen oxidase